MNEFNLILMYLIFRLITVEKSMQFTGLVT